MSINSLPKPAGAGAAPIDDPRRRRAVMLGVCLALMAVIASVSGLNVAQPDIAVEFGVSQRTVLWVINIYTIALAALLLPLGAVGDRWGRKPVLLAGLVIFGIASAAGGLAGSAEILLASRVLAGVGAAMIMPVTLAVITSSFPAEARSQAIGVWTGVAGAGGLLGMFLSALLVDVATWRWLFVLPVVLVLAAVVVAVRSIPDSRETFQHAFVAFGAVTSVVAVVGLILVLHEGPERGWTDPVTLASLVVGVLGAVVFVVGQSRREGPLLDVSLFRQRGLASGSVTLLAVFGVQAGVAVVLYPYLQAVLGWSGLLATVAILPMALLMMLTSGLAPRIAGAIGARATMALGIALGTVGLVLMAGLVSVEGGYLSVLPGIVAMGLGMGLAMTPSTEAITSSLPRSQQGVASALNDVTREFGTALGVALLGAVLSAGYRTAIGPRLEGVTAGTAETAREGVSNALAVADTAGPQAATLVSAAKESFVDGWQQGMWVGAGVMTVLLVVALVRGPQRRPTGDATTEVDADQPAGRRSPTGGQAA